MNTLYRKRLRIEMSVLLWCKEIALLLLIGVSCNANEDCKTISNCEMVCRTKGPSYRCSRLGLKEVPSFPESTVELYVFTIFWKKYYILSTILYNM